MTARPVKPSHTHTTHAQNLVVVPFSIMQLLKHKIKSNKDIEIKWKRHYLDWWCCRVKAPQEPLQRKTQNCIKAPFERWAIPSMWSWRSKDGHSYQIVVYWYSWIVGLGQMHESLAPQLLTPRNGLEVVPSLLPLFLQLPWLISCSNAEWKKENSIKPMC